MQRAVENLNYQMYMLPPEVEQGYVLSCFSLQIVNKYPFQGVFSAKVFVFLCFLGGLHGLKWLLGTVLKNYPVFQSMRRL